jgi:peptidoglycan/xylan/chitin deacetylase (PgdA/CDA1 family)
VSLCFDDGLLSQIYLALPLLSQYGMSATFYLSSLWMEGLGATAKDRMIAPWIAASAAGHEIGNHTRSHPCTTNFGWVKQNRCEPLEDMSLAEIEQEIDAAQITLQAQIRVTPITFAYPCGMTFVGRNVECRSYVPLVAKRFLVGRTYNNQCAADPIRCDLAQVPAVGLDNRKIPELIQLIDEARRDGTWIILVGHHIANRSAKLSTDLGVLRSLLEYLDAHRGEIWVDTVGRLGLYVRDLQTSAAIF